MGAASWKESWSAPASGASALGLRQAHQILVKPQSFVDLVGGARPGSSSK